MVKKTMICGMDCLPDGAYFREEDVLPIIAALEQFANIDLENDSAGDEWPELMEAWRNAVIALGA